MSADQLNLNVGKLAFEGDWMGECLWQSIDDATGMTVAIHFQNEVLSVGRGMGTEQAIKNGQGDDPVAVLAVPGVDCRGPHRMTTLQMIGVLQERGVLRGEPPERSLATGGIPKVGLKRPSRADRARGMLLPVFMLLAYTLSAFDAARGGGFMVWLGLGIIGVGLILILWTESSQPHPLAQGPFRRPSLKTTSVLVVLLLAVIVIFNLRPE